MKKTKSGMVLVISGLVWTVVAIAVRVDLTSANAARGRMLATDRVGRHLWKKISAMSAVHYQQSRNFQLPVLNGSRGQKSDKENSKERRRYLKLANEHVKQMLKAECSSPRPKVLPVGRFISLADKQYLPRCVILHRCERAAGCCPEPYVCSAAKKNKVDLYFRVMALSDNGRVIPTGEIASHTFVNHTKCECKIRKIKRPRVLESRMVSVNGVSSQRASLLITVGVVSLVALL